MLVIFIVSWAGCWRMASSGCFGPIILAVTWELMMAWIRV